MVRVSCEVAAETLPLCSRRTSQAAGCSNLLDTLGEALAEVVADLLLDWVVGEIVGRDRCQAHRHGEDDTKLQALHDFPAVDVGGIGPTPFLIFFIGIIPGSHRGFRAL